MNKNFILFLGLVFLASVLCENQLKPTNSSQSLPQGSRKGYSIIYKDSRGYYVGVDLKYDPRNRSDDFGPDTYQMQLGLYSSQTLLPSKCLDFAPYSCKKDSCVVEETDQKAVFPYFYAFGDTVSTAIYLEYNHWYLSRDSYAMLAKDCTSLTSYGRDSYGIIALGREGESEYNYNGHGYPLFSVYLSKDKTGGKLIFGNDQNYSNSTSPVAQWDTDANWRTYFDGFMKIELHSLLLRAYLIFDINSEAIGLPRYMFDWVVTYLGRHGLDCDSSPYQPICTYSGYLSNLPDIFIIQESMKIPIPPQVYVYNGTNPSYVSSVMLNIRALGINEAGNSYVTTEYKNTIILDSNFMRYYYTVFDGSDRRDEQKILIYLAREFATPSDSKAIYFVLAAFVALLIGIAICNRYNKTVKKSKESESTIVQPPLVIHNQAPLYSPNAQYVQPNVYAQDAPNQGFNNDSPNSYIPPQAHENANPSSQ